MRAGIKSRVIQLRVAPSIKDLIKLAADSMGLSITNFVQGAALSVARDYLERVLTDSAPAMQRQLLQELELTPAAREALRDAAERRRTALQSFVLLLEVEAKAAKGRA